MQKTPIKLIINYKQQSLINAQVHTLYIVSGSFNPDFPQTRKTRVTQTSVGPENPNKYCQLGPNMSIKSNIKINVLNINVNINIKSSSSSSACTTSA